MKLAESGYYDGYYFIGVIKGFMVQADQKCRSRTKIRWR
ncbi:MAG: peptidylprolyl isomerase [Saprospiraceae bacterium]|nr:peptidylprolyl isomerase [Saprospiraceae bacterium]